MIVQRLTFHVKVGCMQQVVDLVKAEGAKLENPPKWRAYTPRFTGVGDVFVEELEFENLTQLEEHWDAWFARPDNPEFFQKFHQLIEPGTANEIWDLVSF